MAPVFANANNNKRHFARIKCRQMRVAPSLTFRLNQNQSIGSFRTRLIFFYERGVDCSEVVYERSSTGRDRSGLI